MRVTSDIYKVANAIQTGKLVMNIKKEAVTKEHFYSKLEEKVKELTSEAPEKYEEALAMCKGVLEKPNMLTVGDITFEYLTITKTVK